MKSAISPAYLIAQLHPLLSVLQTAVRAGHEIKKIYNTSDFKIEYKKDKSPLSTADLSSNRIINAALKDSGIPILSEENLIADYAERKTWDTFWLVDPLDGTKEFINRRDEFTVNIALISDSVPLFGVIYAPVLNNLYFGGEDIGSFRLQTDAEMMLREDDLKKAIPLPVDHPKDPLLIKVVASRSHLSEETKEYINSLKTDNTQIEFLSRGSSLKLCMVAEGSADIYPRLGPTMEWDIAAGHAILKYAGKNLIDFYTKKELTYNKENLLNPYFIAK